jgi:FlaG/FlaF family flagellin (archaellin)
MIRARITAGLAGCIALAVMGSSTLAIAEQTSIKKLMGENFSGLQRILIALITSNYAAVPEHANAIHEHAAELAGMAPEGPNADRQEFLSYAYNLDVHARDIKSIVTLLIQNDKDSGTANLGANHLRGALAAHYGGMVTMCVACHNRFRPTMVE